MYPSNVCFFIGNEIGSNVARKVFEETGDHPSLLSNAVALLSPMQRENQQQHWSSRSLVMVFWLYISPKTGRNTGMKGLNPGIE